MAHALIFGASGISGWALMKEALSYPDQNSFAKVTGLANRPLSKEDTFLPQDSRLQLVSGINLTASVSEVVAKLQENVDDIDTVSHVFFMAYTDPGKGYDALREINTTILKTAIEAVQQVTKKLQTIVLQTGGKGYGVEFSDKLKIRAPLKETQDRIPEPYYQNIFYYTQYDLLKSLSDQKSWTFTEIRPDVIVGFVPSTNFMNVAQGLGLYLSLYRSIRGSGANIPFPGTQKSWVCKHTDTSQDILARQEIYCALNHDKAGNGQVFNSADGAITTWKEKWPGICAYFDLVGEGVGDYQPVDEFVEQNVQAWDGVVEKHNLKSGRMQAYDWKFLDFVMRQFDFDRQYDLSKSREIGFNESVDTVSGYKLAFDRMRKANIIP